MYMNTEGTQINKYFVYLINDLVHQAPLRLGTQRAGKKVQSKRDLITAHNCQHSLFYCSFPLCKSVTIYIL